MKTFHYCRTFPLLPLFYHLLLSPHQFAATLFVCVRLFLMGLLMSAHMPHFLSQKTTTEAAQPTRRPLVPDRVPLWKQWLQWNAVCSHGWAQASTFGCRHQLARINGNKDSSNAHFNKPSQTNKRTSVSNVRTRVYKRQFSKTTT